MKMLLPPLCLLSAALAIGEAQAQIRTTDFVLLPDSVYTFLPSGMGGFPDCDLNDDLQCDFQITGSFTLEEDFSDGTAAIIDADLEIDSGVDPNPPLTLLTAEGVEDFLEGLPFESVPAPTIMTIYEATSPVTPRTPPITIAFDTPGFGGSLTGGYDGRPVDGNGVMFDVGLRRVPEPASMVVALSALALVPGFRRRR